MTNSGPRICRFDRVMMPAAVRVGEGDERALFVTDLDYLVVLSS